MRLHVVLNFWLDYTRTQTQHTHAQRDSSVSLDPSSLFSPFFHTPHTHTEICHLSSPFSHTHAQRSVDLSSPFSHTHAQRSVDLSSPLASSAPSLSKLSFLSAPPSPRPTYTHAHHRTCFRKTPIVIINLVFLPLLLVSATRRTQELRRVSWISPVR